MSDQTIGLFSVWYVDRGKTKKLQRLLSLLLLS